MPLKIGLSGSGRSLIDRIARVPPAGTSIRNSAGPLVATVMVFSATPSGPTSTRFVTLDPPVPPPETVIRTTDRWFDSPALRRRPSAERRAIEPGPPSVSIRSS